MSQSSFLQTVVIPLLTVILTLLGTQWQISAQSERTERASFVDGAISTAQETSRLLDEGYYALNKLVSESDEKGWDEFSKTSWRTYKEFQRPWRRQLIAQHFKLARYFGKDLADQLVHVDEIDLHPTNNLHSPNICAPAGDETNFDVEKLAVQTECVTRLITVGYDMGEQSKMREAGEFLDHLASQRAREEFAWKLLQHYDKVSVSYLRQLNARLTQLGEPQVTVVAREPKT